MLRVCAVLIVLFISSVPLAGSGEIEPRLARTTASPSTFTLPVMVNDNKANDQSAPVIVATPDDKLIVVWQDLRSGNEDIYLSRSLDNCTTFTSNKRVDDSSGSSRQIEPAAVVTANGTILLAWQDNRRSIFDNDIYFTKSYDGGTTFKKNVKVDDSNGVISWQERPSITVTSSGVIYVAWTDDRTGYLRVRGAFSTNGGATFSPSEEMASSGGLSGQTGVSLACNGKRIFAAFMDNVTGVAHPYLCISTNSGQSFTTPIRLDNAGASGAYQRGVSIAVMPGGGIIAAWEEYRNGNPDICACIVSFNGAITTSSFRVDDDSSGAYQQSVSIVADQLGNIYAVWTDEREGLSAIRFSYLVAGETRFNASVEVDRPGASAMQRRATIVTTEPGRVFVTWQEDSSLSYDVYASAAYFPDLMGLSLKGGCWNFVSLPGDGYAYRASTLGLRPGDVVAGWDSAIQFYSQNYIEGFSPPSEDFTLSPNSGYWIYSEVHVRVHLKGTIPTVKQNLQVVVPRGGGWVFIGLDSLDVTRCASEIPAMYSGGEVLAVLCYDTGTQAYLCYYPDIPEWDFMLAPGQAILCYCSANGTLTYSP